MDNQNQNKNKNKSRTTRFLIGSFFALLLISAAAFISLAQYMGQASERAIEKAGNLYMSGINKHISSHFQTLIDLKLEQAQTAAEVVPSDEENIDEMYEELMFRVRVRNFNYLALCSESGKLQMLEGEQISPTDPEPFYESLRQDQKKVAVGSDTTGNEIIMFGISADYPMKNGEKCIAMVAAVPIEYIQVMLGSDDDEWIYSHIIRKDGSFIISNIPGYSDYFSSLYERYGVEDTEKIDAYIKGLSEAMAKKEAYSGLFYMGGSKQQVYCTPLPYSEWHLVTILPSGALDEAVETLERDRMSATAVVGAAILAALLIIFYAYFKMTRQQLKDLEAARQEALQATKAKSTFLSNMSHDIRTPMNAIVGMTAIATTYIDDKEQVQNCLRKISLSGKHLLGLINDVLDMSKIESGKMTLTEERISLREAIESIVGIVQAQVRAKGQNFNVHTDNIVSEDVYCDSVRLNQVLLNLISNAVKYTKEGGTIQLSMYQEDLSSEAASGHVRTHIIVKDNGIGMTEEFLTHIFDSYSRADSKRVQKTEGAGLGMAITKYIVDAMGGTIDVKSEPDKGTEFHVVLDLEKADEQEMDMILPPWKILVVDDDEELCRTAVGALDSIGIQADWTLSGIKALEMVEKHHRERDNYQIILLDWKLPDMDSLIVAQKIRRIIDVDLPIILISAYDWSEFETEARAAGVSGFIAKPLFKSTLYHGLKKYMGVEEAEEESDPGKDLSGRRILVAEDNDLNWEILDELLSHAGLELEWAQNGKICLEKFQASEQGHYDAILMDIRMPVMSGYECTKAIRALSRPDAGEIPIIAMTADAFSEDIQRCMESGMNAHTAKPINLDEVLSLLQKYILN